MRVLRVEPGKKPTVIEIKDGLKALQAQVEGYVTAVYFPDGAALLCNEEGPLRRMEPNRALRDDEGNIVDVIVGPFLIVGVRGSSLISLSDELVAKYAKCFQMPERFLRIGETVIVTPYEEDAL